MKRKKMSLNLKKIRNSLLFFLLLWQFPLLAEEASTLYQKGILYFNNAQYSKAEIFFFKAIKANPNFPEPYYNLGIYYDTIAQNHKKAVEEYSRYIVLNGKKKEKAQAWLKKITSLKAKFSSQETKNITKGLKLYNKAVKKIQKKQYDHALSLVNDSIAILPYYIGSLYLRGRIYYQKHYFLNALRDFEQTYFYDSSFQDTAYYLALTYDLFSDKEKKAFQLYEEVLNNPKTSKARKKIIKNLLNNIKKITLLKQEAYGAYKSNDLNKVEKIYKEILEMRPNNITACNNMGVVYMQRGKNKEALQYLLSASKINPYDPNPNYNLACLYSKQKQKNKALFYYKLALPYMSSVMKTHSLNDSDLVFVKKEIQPLLQQ